MAAWRCDISLLVLKEKDKRNFVSKRNFVYPRAHVISSMSESAVTMYGKLSSQSIVYSLTDCHTFVYSN